MEPQTECLAGHADVFLSVFCEFLWQVKETLHPQTQRQKSRLRLQAPGSRFQAQAGPTRSALGLMMTVRLV